MLVSTYSRALSRTPLFAPPLPAIPVTLGDLPRKDRLEAATRLASEEPAAGVHAWFSASSAHRASVPSALAFVAAVKLGGLGVSAALALLLDLGSEAPGPASTLSCLTWEADACLQRELDGPNALSQQRP